jgi:hypothetical protein
MKKIIFLFIAILSLASVSAYAGGLRGLTPPPIPELVYPSGESADITGKDSLEFKWILYSTVGLGCTDFKLYKGYITYEDNRILKAEVDSPQAYYSVSSDKFEDGQVYTWVLREVSLAGVWGDYVYNSFRVVKRTK